MIKTSGTEPIEVNWTKDKKPLKYGDIYTISYDKGTAKLSISEVFPEDSGNYSVEVKNQWGSASSTASLQVNGEYCYILTPLMQSSISLAYSQKCLLVWLTKNHMTHSQIPLCMLQPPPIDHVKIILAQSTKSMTLTSIHVHQDLKCHQ